MSRTSFLSCSSVQSGCCERRKASLCLRTVQYNCRAACQRCSGVIALKMASCSGVACSSGRIGGTMPIVSWASKHLSHGVIRRSSRATCGRKGLYAQDPPFLPHSLVACFMASLRVGGGAPFTLENAADLGKARRAFWPLRVKPMETRSRNSFRRVETLPTSAI